jgi:sugar/nucleoside kinase (ribokinase family)
MITPDYLLIGHMTADLTPDGRIAGGTVSYAARTVAAFGLRVGLLTSAANEEPLLNDLRTIADVISLPAEQTTTYENIYLPSGRVQYVRGAAARIRKTDVTSQMSGAPLIHLAPIADEIDWDIVESFGNGTVLLTLQGWLRRWDSEGLVHFKRWHNAETLKRIDIVVFSEEDIIESPDMEAAFAGSVPHLFVTRADKGGTYYRNGVPTTYSTPQVKLVNQTGAGDVFAAALLASLPAFDHDIQAAAQVAARLAAISVTRNGLDSAPTMEEVQRTLAEVTAERAGSGKGG